MRERSHSLSSSVCAPHALCFCYSLSLSHLSLPSFLPCDSFSIYVFLFFCLSQAVFTPVSHSFFSFSFHFFSCFLSLSPSPPHLIGCGAPVAVIGWQMNDLSSLSVMCVSEQLLTNHWPRTSFCFWHAKLLNLSPGQEVLNVWHVLHVSLVNMFKGKRQGWLLWLQCSDALPIW